MEKRTKNTKMHSKRKLEDKNEMDKTKKFKIKKKKNPKVRKIIKTTILTILFVLIILLGITIGKIYGIFKEAKLNMEDIVIKYENTVVKDIDGNTTAVLSGDENREYVSMSEMSEYLPKAFVAIEDERFYEHNGVDIKRTGAATVKYALSKLGIGSADYGGSTITQQFLKVLTEERERTWQRKVKEIARAYYLEQELSKSQILEMYLNLIFLGGRTFGVEVASNYYFSKSAKDLSLAESAFLAGINDGPNYYDAFSTEEKDINKIKKRTKIVIEKMYELGKENPEHKAGITEEEYNIAMAEVENGLAFNKGKITQTVFSYHTDAAVAQVKEDLKEKYPDWTDEYLDYYVKSGGLTIYTTQKTEIQNIMEEEVKKEKYIEYSKYEFDNDGNPVTAQTAMVLIDHKTGYVLATVGGIGEKTTAFGLNRATQSYRQPGSTAKPIAVVVPGIDSGILTAATGYDDISYSSGKYAGYKNYGYSYMGLTTVRYAVAQSKNIPMLKAIEDVGIERSTEYLKNLGIELTDSQKNITMALGSFEASPLQMAAAYATIANDGVYIEPTFYTKVVDSEGNVILQAEQETRTVMSTATAYIVKEMLTEVVRSGAGGYAAISGISVGVKTGTSSSDVDRWFCGFTPYYTAATWYGYDNNKVSETVRMSNINPSGRIWDGVMEQIHKGLPKAKFSDTKPSNVTSATVCKVSGKLATDYCKNDPRGSQVYTEYFIKGTVPKETCDCHVCVDICQDTGLIANEYCPHKITQYFITRSESETGNWQKASDAKYMLTVTETCTTHKKTVEPEKPTENNGNTTGNNTTGDNTTGNNTAGNNTTSNNTTGNNTISGNTTGNNTVQGNTTIPSNTTTNTVSNTITNNNTTNGVTIQNISN